MKFSKLFLMIAVVSSAVSQASANPDDKIGKIFQAGQAIATALEGNGTRLPLNPIYCLSTTPGVEMVIYSRDMRHDGKVYVVNGGNMLRILVLRQESF